jgi:hypothetical protein
LTVVPSSDTEYKAIIKSHYHHVLLDYTSNDNQFSYSHIGHPWDMDDLESMEREFEIGDHL